MARFDVDSVVCLYVETGRLISRRFAIGPLCSISVFLLYSPPAHSQQLKKLALVIGNAKYSSPNELNNPTHDSDLIAGALKNLGFTLIGGGPNKNLGLTDFNNSLEAFSIAAKNADVAVFYFSGHGIQLSGENFLVPIGANPTNGESDVPKQMVSASSVLKILDNSHIRLKILILDACRNNPFATKGYLPPSQGLAAMSQGLTAMKAPVGTVIWYAAGPGETASDAGTNGGPFSVSIVDNIMTPGDDIYTVFNHTGLEVMKKTNNVQQPWLAATPIDGIFYFREIARSGKSLFVKAPTPSNKINSLFANGVSAPVTKFIFGDDYDTVNKNLSSQFSILSWEALPKAYEFAPDEVRYFWVNMSSLPSVSSSIFGEGLSSERCVDPSSYIVFLFRNKKLFSVSMRFAKSAKCPGYDWIFASLFSSASRTQAISSAQGITLISAHDELYYSVIDVTKKGQARTPVSIYGASYVTPTK